MMNPQSRLLAGITHMLCILSFLWLLVFTLGMGARVPIVGTPAPDFQLTDLSGERHQLSQYRGQIVLINFWATWCKPCTKEMPAMQAAYERLKDRGLVVLAINELEDVEKVRAHIAEYGYTFPVLLDPNNTVANLFGVYGLPVTVFVDRQGVIREYIKGGLLTEEKIYNVVKAISAPQQTTAR
ncbi:MAG: TlpA family protein disulfide reductase [Nitrospirae bacterium]|nr:MAG: TlpA family protein disulfide reductase [Nitrospirota bacterium]